jgi:hypothetical protein
MGSTVIVNTSAAGLQLNAGETYQINLSEDFVREASIFGTPSPAINNALSFTTSATAPSISASNPSNGATNIGNISQITITFDRNVVRGTGNFYVYNNNDPFNDGLIKTLSITNTSQTSIAGAVVTLNIGDILNGNDTFYVLADSGVIKDFAGVQFTGISNENTLRFSTSTNEDLFTIFDRSAALTVTASVTASISVSRAAASANLVAVSNSSCTPTLIPPLRTSANVSSVAAMSSGSLITPFEVAFMSDQLSDYTYVEDTPAFLINNPKITDTVYVNIYGDPGFRALRTLSISNVSTTTISKIGVGSLVFPNNGVITTEDTTYFGFGTNDFTWESWIYLGQVDADQCIFKFSNGSGIFIRSNNQIAFRDSDGGAFLISSGLTVAIDTWYHVAVVRQSAQIKMYVDGVKVGATYTDPLDIGTTNSLRIGQATIGVADYQFVGYMDEVRISQTARYTANFTPSLSQFNNDNNTSLLIRGDATITDVNDFNSTFEYTFKIYPDTVAAVDDIYLPTNYVAVQEFLASGGTQSFDNTAKELTITGSRGAVNSMLDLVVLETSSDYTGNFVLNHQVRTPENNTKQRQQNILLGEPFDNEVINHTLNRSYFTNDVSNLFAANKPTITDFDTDVTYTVELSVNSGVLGWYGTNSENLTTTTYTSTLIIGPYSRVRMNNLINSVAYFPVKDNTSNVTMTYELYKEGNLHADSTFTLGNIGSSVIDKYIVIGTSNASSNVIESYQPLQPEIRYCNLSYWLVGGGGGGTSEVQPYYANSAADNTPPDTLIGAGGGGGQIVSGSISTIPNALITATAGVGGLHGRVVGIYDSNNQWTNDFVNNNAQAGNNSTLFNGTSLNETAVGGGAATRGNGAVPGDGGDSGSNQGSIGLSSGVNYVGGLGAGAVSAATAATTFSNGVVGAGQFITTSLAGAQILAGQGGGRSGSIYNGSGSTVPPTNFNTVTFQYPDSAHSNYNGYRWGVGGNGGTKISSSSYPFDGGNGLVVLRIKNF